MPITQSLLDELWDFSDAAGSEARLREAREEQTDAEDRAELDTQVARALGLQERFAEAHAILDRVDVSHDALAARAALERGRLHNSAGDHERAVAYFLAAVDAASRAGHVFLQVDALHMLAIAEPEQGEEWTDAGLAALEGVDDPRTLRWRVSLHNNAGGVCSTRVASTRRWRRSKPHGMPRPAGAHRSRCSGPTRPSPR